VAGPRKRTDLAEPEIAVGTERDSLRMGSGWEEGVGIGNSVTTPAGVIRPIALPLFSVNQTLPSGPAVRKLGSLAVVGTGNSLIVPGGVAAATGV
jgi:hypothetical protein